MTYKFLFIAQVKVICRRQTIGPVCTHYPKPRISFTLMKRWVLSAVNITTQENYFSIIDNRLQHQVGIILLL
jgi:hypothetical protein